MATQATKRSGVRDLFTVLSGTTGAQAIGLLILPFLAREFAPEAFGVFQLYLSLLIFCTVGIALRIELTLVSTQEEELKPLLASLFALVVFTGLGICLLMLVVESLGVNFGFPIWLFALGLLGNGLVQITVYKLIRDQSYRNMAALKIAQVVIYAVAALTIAFVSPTVEGLIFADVAGRLAAAILSLTVNGQSFSLARKLIAFRQLPRFIRHNWDMVRSSFPGAMANSAAAMLTPVMIFHVFGATDAGQYSLVERSIGLPVAMIVTAGSQVFLGMISVHLRASEYHAALRRLLRLVAISTVATIAAAIIIKSALPYVFPILFGPGWEIAMMLSGIMIFGYAAAFVGGIINQTLIALREFRWQSIWDLGWLVSLGAAWLLVLNFNLTIFTAVMFHSAILIIKSAVFILLCVLRLRTAAEITTPQMYEARK